MGCGGSTEKISQMKKSEKAIKAAILIQGWYRRYVARLEARRRCTWTIFQSMEYEGEQTQLKLYNFFNNMLAHVSSPRSTETIPTTDSIKYSDELKEGGTENSNDVFIDAGSIYVENSYKGPMLPCPITTKGVGMLLDACKKNQLIHVKFVVDILQRGIKILKKLPNINNTTTDIKNQITVVGDLHGKLDDLFIIFYKNGPPSNENPYIFNGDFVDRGTNSVEVTLILIAFLILYPTRVILNRGNHEDRILNIRYGFAKELQQKYRKYTKKLTILYDELFRSLPLATVIDRKIFVVHGGISIHTNLKTIRTLNRHKYISALKPQHIKDLKELFDYADLHELMDGSNRLDIQEWRQVLDLLWSDPAIQNGCHPNKSRGGGSIFGPDVTKKFLADNGLSMIIRSHECKQEGYGYSHGTQVLTVFSASNYYEIGSNRGAYCKIGPALQLRLVQYMASKSHRRLTVRQRLTVVEQSALKDLKCKIYANKSTLMLEFRKYDLEKKGVIRISQWSQAVGDVLNLNLPWRTIRSQLVRSVDDMVEYETSLDEYSISNNMKLGDQSLTEALYKHKESLETIFRLMDKDNSGFISMEEFVDACKLLQLFPAKYLEDQAYDLARSIDINKDGQIDFNEFLEAFRLVDQNGCDGQAQSDKNIITDLTDIDDGTGTTVSPVDGGYDRPPVDIPGLVVGLTEEEESSTTQQDSFVETSSDTVITGERSMIASDRTIMKVGRSSSNPTRPYTRPEGPVKGDSMETELFPSIAGDMDEVFRGDDFGKRQICPEDEVCLDLVQSM